jgi:Domain of unknown function (DUF1963)
MTDDLIDILRRSRRSCSVAEIVSGRPVDSGPISCMGGGFYGKPGELWPTNDHGVMLPLVQIAFAQVPILPECLTGFLLLTMFLDRRQLPMDGDAANGDGWLLRTYQGDDELVPLVTPAELWADEYPRDRRHFAFNKQFPPRVTRLSWRKGEADYPGWEDYGSLLPHFNWDFEDLYPKYTEIAKCEYGTKVGGWPTYIQGGGAGSQYDFAFQVASQEKPRVLFGDSGNVYVFRTPDGWHLWWDCY